MFYNDILDKCRYSEKLTFEKEQYTHERRNRGRNIIWYNPPFSKNVKTNIAKIVAMSKLVIVAWII